MTKVDCSITRKFPRYERTVLSRQWSYHNASAVSNASTKPVTQIAAYPPRFHASEPSAEPSAAPMKYTVM